MKEKVAKEINAAMDLVVKPHRAYIAPFPMTAEVVRRFNYRCEPLASGGTGQIFVQERNGKEVVVKMPWPNPNDERIVSREAAWLPLLYHPNIIEVYARFGYVGRRGLWVCAMERHAGNARDYFRTAEAIEYGRALYVLREAAKGLAYLHGRGIVHGDMTWRNILLKHYFEGTLLPKVALCDFGFARREGRKIWFEQRGGLCGTAEFMSPECHLMGVPDKKDDVYGLSRSLYVFLGGRFNYRSGTTIIFPNSAFAAEVSRISMIEDECIQEDFRSLLFNMAMPGGSIHNGAELVAYIDRHFPKVKHATTVEDLDRISV